MMAPVHRINANDANPLKGRVKIDFVKTIWTGGLIFSGLILAPFFTNLNAIFLGLSLTYITLLLGHSVGMHRMMIHRSFKAVGWVRYSLLYLGTLVGIGGPSSVIRIHDTRDWAQRAPRCHAYFSHEKGYWRDISWQLFYRFEFDSPSSIEIESEISDDAFLKHLDKYWRFHQLALASALYLIGGLPFVIWGVSIRVAISTIGHWTITYICHNPGPGRWHVQGAGVQASNLKLPSWVGGLLTHGECWHNNHHAFPESAQIGLYKGELDPAWIIISTLQKYGLIFDVSRPRQDREDLAERSPLSNS